MQHVNPHLLMRSKFTYQGQRSSRSSCKMWKWKWDWKCESGLIWKVEVRLEPNLVYWYYMETFLCSCGQRSYTKVKGHLRSSCKIGWNVKMASFEKLKSDLNPNLAYGNLHMFMRSKGHKSKSKVIWGQVFFLPYMLTISSNIPNWPFFKFLILPGCSFKCYHLFSVA